MGDQTIPIRPDAQNPTGGAVPQEQGERMLQDALTTPVEPAPSEPSAEEPAAPAESNMVQTELGEFSIEDINAILGQHQDAVDLLERQGEIERQFEDIRREQDGLADLKALRDLLQENPEIRKELET